MACCCRVCQIVEPGSLDQILKYAPFCNLTLLLAILGTAQKGHAVIAYLPSIFLPCSYFLDNVAGWILEVDRGAVYPHLGNYRYAANYCNAMRAGLAIPSRSSLNRRYSKLRHPARDGERWPFSGPQCALTFGIIMYLYACYGNTHPKPPHMYFCTCSGWLARKAGRLDLEKKHERKKAKAMEEELKWIRQGVKVSGPGALRPWASHLLAPPCFTHACASLTPQHSSDFFPCGNRGCPTWFSLSAQLKACFLIFLANADQRTIFVLRRAAAGPAS